MFLSDNMKVILIVFLGFVFTYTVCEVKDTSDAKNSDAKSILHDLVESVIDEHNNVSKGYVFNLN